MPVRALAILVTLCGLVYGLAAVAVDPGLLALFAGKVVEGGMWTALAVFIPAAMVLRCRPRGAAGRARGSLTRRR